MQYLKLTNCTEPKNPNDGNPYIYYNKGIDTVWIFMGVKWILETGYWQMQKQWANDGRWNYFGPLVN